MITMTATIVIIISQAKKKNTLSHFWYLHLLFICIILMEKFGWVGLALLEILGLFSEVIWHDHIQAPVHTRKYNTHMHTDTCTLF